MPDYRLYQLHPQSGHFTDVEDIPAADDKTAISEARQRGHAVPLELWSGGRGGAYRAREAQGEERERLWKLATHLYPGYDDYQRRADSAGRRIPVVVCEPRDPEAA